MSRLHDSAVRWLKGASNRTFVAWPVALFGVEAARAGGWPTLDAWAIPLLAAGYLLYRLVGRYRLREGGGGPGMSNPPERLVTNGPYRWTRNPMYVGHLFFFAGLAVLLHSDVAAAVGLAHATWFDWRVRRDERRLEAQFGEPYRDYHRRVKRWIPGLY